MATTAIQRQNHLRTLSPAQLAELRAKYENALAEKKLLIEEIDQHIAVRFKGDADRAYAEAKKVSGDLTIDLGIPGLKLKGSIDAKVTYDSDVLLAAAQTMTWDQAKEVFKFDLSVPAATYKAMPGLNPELFKKVQAARTVKYGERKLRLVSTSSD